MICIIFIVVSICLAISCVLRGCKMAMVRFLSKVRKENDIYME